MSDQLPMFDPTSSPDTPSAISSPESGSGATRSDLPNGQTTAKSGPDHAHANPSARPAKEKRSTTKGIFGQSSFGSSKHEDLSFALANKLRPLTDSLGSTLFNLTWMTRVTPAGRSISALRASEPLTEGSVFIGWPTPKTPTGGAESGARKKELGRMESGGGDLGAAAWPTPRAEDAESSGMRHSRAVADTMTAVASLAGWPTPVANDDNKTPEAHLAMKARMGERDGSGANRTAITSLQVMAQLAGWKTPTACTPNSLRGNGQEPETREAGGHTINLQDQVRLAGWKTPRVPNGGRISGNATDIGKRQDGTKAQIGLENEAKLSGWTTPQAHDQTGHSKGQKEIHGTKHGCADLVTEARLTAFGEMPIGYLLGRNGWEIVPASGQLNAAHSRWLMALPPVWDDCGVTAMESLRKRRKRS